MRLVAKISEVSRFGRGTPIYGVLVGYALFVFFLAPAIGADPASEESGGQKIETGVLDQREKIQPLMPAPAAPDRRPATFEQQVLPESFPEDEPGEDDYVGPDYGEDGSKAEVKVENPAVSPVEIIREPVKSITPSVKEPKNVIQDTPVIEKSIKKEPEDDLLRFRDNVIKTKSQIKNLKTEIQIADEFILNPDDFIFYGRPEMRKKSSEQSTVFLETETTVKEKTVAVEPEIPGKASPLLDRIFGVNDSKNKNILNLVILCVLIVVFLMYRIRNGGSGRKFS